MPGHGVGIVDAVRGAVGIRLRWKDEKRDAETPLQFDCGVVARWDVRWSLSINALGVCFGRHGLLVHVLTYQHSSQSLAWRRWGWPERSLPSQNLGSSHDAPRVASA